MAPVLDLEVYYFTCPDLPRGLTSVLIVINVTLNLCNLMT